MHGVARRVVVLALGAILAVTIAPHASARQLIVYRGETAQAPRWNQVRLYVLKRDDGRRSLRDFAVEFTTTCEDSTTVQFSLDIGRKRLSQTGEFQVGRRRSGDPFSYSYNVTGQVRFGSADGTFEFNYAALTEEDQPQLCTTGTLDWSAERRRSRRPTITTAAASEGGTSLKIYRHGELVEVAGR